MQAITIKKAKKNLEQLLTQVIDDAEATIVILETGQQVVVMPFDEYNAWQETRYLLANPSNAAHLRQSIAEANTIRCCMRPTTHTTMEMGYPNP